MFAITCNKFNFFLILKVTKSTRGVMQLEAVFFRERWTYQ